MRIKPTTAEISLSTANTVGNSTVVRIYNNTAGDVLITNTVTTASFTMPPGSIANVVKDATDTLTAGAAVLATGIAYS